ncbi:MAG: NADH-quinone oxidoreductase subunit J family protein [Chitinophagaceae bacterium]
MYISEILFWTLSAITVLAAFIVVLSKHPIYSILALIVVFFGISGHYILMNAQFIGVVNIIVYAGAIMVLFLFVVMMMNLNKQEEPHNKPWMLIAATISGMMILLIIVAALHKMDQLQNKIVNPYIGEEGLVQNLGKVLFTDFVLPFEISSILFLIAILGAVTLAKKN